MAIVAESCACYEQGVLFMYDMIAACYRDRRPQRSATGLLADSDRRLEPFGLATLTAVAKSCPLLGT